jgi:hypothetical protein
MDGGAAESFSDGAVTPLSAIADAFEELAKLLNSRKDESKEEARLRLDTFCDACSWVSVLFGCLGLAFKFAESEYVSKVVFLYPFIFSSLWRMYDRSLGSFTYN